MCATTFRPDTHLRDKEADESANSSSMFKTANGTCTHLRDKEADESANSFSMFKTANGTCTHLRRRAPTRRNVSMQATTHTHTFASCARVCHPPEEPREASIGRALARDSSVQEYDALQPPRVPRAAAVEHGENHRCTIVPPARAAVRFATATRATVCDAARR